jgi:hypothetical protein
MGKIYHAPPHSQHHSKYGMIVSLRGKLWDLGTDGELIVYNRGEVFCPTAMQGASMVNLWIN